VIGLGPRTLFAKEVRRFLRVPGQTVLSPLVTTSLYFLVFGWSLGSRLREVEGVSYARFIVPGLVMLGVITNSFLNTSSSIMVMKLQGTMIDLLVSPISYGEILGAFVGAAAVRGALVGGVVWLVAACFTGFEVAHPLHGVLALLLVAVTFASLGFVTGIWARTFEQVNFFPTFIITPLTFLGGVFYSAGMLPGPLRTLTLANPVYFMVDALRWGMLGRSQAGAVPGLAIAGGLCAASLGAAYAILRSGWRLRG